MADPLNYAVGELILFSREEYSDYYVARTVVVLKDFDANALLPVWAEEHGKRLHNTPSTTYPSGSYRRNMGQPEFYDWLIENGYVAPVKTRELHVGFSDEVMLSNKNSDTWDEQGGNLVCVNNQTGENR